MKVSNNVPALRAMGASRFADRKLSMVTDRLSTGVRINSAKDDPPGIAISKRMLMQGDGMKVAGQNSQNGISMVQTAEAGLNEIHSILQRVRELSVEAANGTMQSDDRYKVQIEIDQLKLEIDSISEKTQYNNISLLGGHCGTKGRATVADAGGNQVENADANLIQVADTVLPGEYQVRVTSIATHPSYSTVSPTLGKTFPDLALEGTINISGVDVDISRLDTKEDVFKKIKDITGTLGMKVTEGTDRVIDSMTSEYSGSNHSISIQSGNAELLDALGFGAGSAASPGTDAQVELVSGFPVGSSTIQDGNRIIVVEANKQKMVLEVPYEETTVNLTVKDNSLVFQTGANKDINIYVAIEEVTAGSLGIDRLSVMTQKSASVAISQLDSAIGYCSDARGKLGAFQNRLETISTNIGNSKAALDVTLSKIYDTDMAFELAEMSKYKIISQGAVSVLSHAMQRPKQILQLIQ